MAETSEEEEELVVVKSTEKSSASPMARRRFSHAFASPDASSSRKTPMRIVSPPSPPQADRHKSRAAESRRRQTARQRSRVSLFFMVVFLSNL